MYRSDKSGAVCYQSAIYRQITMTAALYRQHIRPITPIALTLSSSKPYHHVNNNHRLLHQSADPNYPSADGLCQHRTVLADTTEAEGLLRTGDAGVNQFTGQNRA